MLKQAYPKIVQRLFKDKEQPAMPMMDRLDLESNVRYTQYRQFDVIHHNEGTLDGTYEVHKDIWLKQLCIPEDNPSLSVPEDKHFAERL